MRKLGTGTAAVPVPRNPTLDPIRNVSISIILVRQDHERGLSRRLGGRHHELAWRRSSHQNRTDILQ